MCIYMCIYMYIYMCTYIYYIHIYMCMSICICFFVVEKTGPLRLTARNILRNLSASPTRSIYMLYAVTPTTVSSHHGWLQQQAKSPTADFTKASISVLGYGAFARHYAMSGNSYATHMKLKAAIQGGITAIQGSRAYSI